MQGMGRPSKGLIAFFVCGQARTSRTSPRTVARTAATLKKVLPRFGISSEHFEKRWFSTSASSAGSSTFAYGGGVFHRVGGQEVTGEAGQTRYFSCSIGQHCRDGQVLTVEWVNATAAPTPAQKKDDSDGATRHAFAAGLYISLAAATALPFLG